LFCKTLYISFGKHREGTNNLFFENKETNFLQTNNLFFENKETNFLPQNYFDFFLQIALSYHDEIFLWLYSLQVCDLKI
jgi:hypothetical protein